MSLTRLVPVILAFLVVSVALFVRSAGLGHRGLALGFAMIAPAVLAIASLMISLPHWSEPQVAIRSDAAIAQARRTARLFAIGFAWAGAAMLATYTGPTAVLRWRHGWQYGGASVAIAALLLGYVHLLATEVGARLRSARLQRAVMWATIACGVGASAAVAWLVYSGKLAVAKSDWAANQIFLAAAITLALLSAISVATKLRMVRDA